MKELSKDEMKKVIGGLEDPGESSCNTYCGSGSNYTCKGQCFTCEDAGNGRNPNVPGGDKLCV